LCVILAAHGYPVEPRSGDVIHGLDAAGALRDVHVYHAGTRRSGADIVTAGGRVLGVTGVGKSLVQAHARAYEAAAAIQFAGKQLRRDIGAQGLGRGKESG
jgi:phosphoribosylamine--glycine ligase